MSYARPVYRESIKESSLKSYGKFILCFICATYKDLTFLVTDEIPRVWLNKFKRKYPSRLQNWFAGCKLIMCWKNFTKLWCRYEFIFQNQSWNSEIVIQWIKQKISRKVTETDSEKLHLNSKFVNNNYLRSPRAYQLGSDVSCKMWWRLSVSEIDSWVSSIREKNYHIASRFIITRTLSPPRDVEQGESGSMFC